MTETQPHSLDTSSYTVVTQIFEGPLDLLLQLIERAELDITKIALAHVTTPFLEYVRQLDAQQAEEVSGFLVIAARLMQIKSEALLPRPPEREPGEEDPAEELVQQLIIYKRYKEISQILLEREKAGHKTYLRLSPPPKVETQLDLSNLSLNDLVASAIQAFSIATEQKPLGTVVQTPRTTVREKIKQITWTLKSSGRATFNKLLGKKYDRVDVVVTFLALLELIKSYKVTAFQDQTFGEIEIETSESWDESQEIEIEFSD